VVRREPRTIFRWQGRPGLIHVTIWVDDGVYPLTFPLEFGPEDYGAFELRACPGASPVFDGGVRIGGWEEAEVNGRACWVADVAAHLLEFGPFRSLFVNGCRRRRARYPSEGYLWIESSPDFQFNSETRSGNSDLLRGSYRFKAQEGDLEGIAGWRDAEVVMLNRWINERMPVAGFDAASRLVTMKTRTRLMLHTEFEEKGKTIRYWIDNVREGMLEPGDWYLDAGASRVFYIPLKGETHGNCEVVIPTLRQFVRICGDPEGSRPAGGLRIEGIAFRHADWCEASTLPVRWDPYRPQSTWRHRESDRSFTEINNADPRIESGSSSQAAFHLPGTIQIEGARDVTIANCKIEHVGFHGIGLAEGCRNIRLVGNTIADMGAGGILLDGGGALSDPRLETGHCSITDNTIHGGGQVFLAACGIATIHTTQNVIAHNEIHDMTYSGISVGWEWGLCDSVSRLHWIYKNHIHHIGTRGDMSDMGGIYLLGPQPGTFVEGNFIHDIETAAYGGWGIYPDEGSSLLTIERNVIVRTASESLHEHMGRQNVVRNNLFLLGGEGGARFSRGERNRWREFPTEGGLFINNIVVTDGPSAIRDYIPYQSRNPSRFDLNLYWNRQGDAVCSIRAGRKDDWQPQTLEERRATGLDLHSVAADPKLADIDGGDFTPAPDSPARALGFEPIEIGDVGPRPDAKRVLTHVAEPWAKI